MGSPKPATCFPFRVLGNPAVPLNSAQGAEALGARLGSKMGGISGVWGVPASALSLPWEGVLGCQGAQGQLFMWGMGACEAQGWRRPWRLLLLPTFPSLSPPLCLAERPALLQPGWHRIPICLVRLKVCTAPKSERPAKGRRSGAPVALPAIPGSTH